MMMMTMMNSLVELMAVTHHTTFLIGFAVRMGEYKFPH